MKRLFLLLLFTGSSLFSYSQHAGDLDTTFGNHGIVTTWVQGSLTYCYSMITQPDGKIIAAGYSRNNTNEDFVLLRLNADGSDDLTFHEDGKVITPIGTGKDIAKAVAIQADGKIIAAGFTVGSTWDYAIARYNTDGTLDNSFGTNGKVTTLIGTTTCYANAIAIQTDGKIVVAGDAFNGSNCNFAVVRYNTDGTLDLTFGLNGVVTTDFASGADNGNAIAIQTDGKIVVAGTTYNGINTDFAVARYKTNGIIDSTFDADGKVITPIGTGNDVGSAVVIQTNGKIVVAGSAVIGSNKDFTLVRYNTDGTLDLTFDTDGKATASFSSFDDICNAVAIQGDGKIVVFGNSSNNYAIARFTSSGSLDLTFSGDGKETTSTGLSTENGNAVSFQPDGKIICGGTSNPNFGFVRYKTDGSIDSTFNNTGIRTVNISNADDYACTVAIQQDGKILSGGYSASNNTHSYALIRLNTNGTLDNSFNNTGRVITNFGAYEDWGKSLAIQPDGKIVLVGNSGGSCSAVRYLSNGTLDNTFGTLGKALVNIGDGSADDHGNSVALQPDGKIVLAGSANTNEHIFYTGIGVARLNTNGAFDTTFSHTGNLVTYIVTSLNQYGYSNLIQPDGKIIVGGEFDFDFCLVRYNTNGTRDLSFGTNGYVTTGGYGTTGYKVLLQPDGKILLAGYSLLQVTRYNTNGSIDSTFGNHGTASIPPNGTIYYGYSAVLQPDGKVIVAGQTRNAPTDDFALARYKSNGVIDSTFGNYGIVATAIGSGEDIGKSVTLQADGKIVLTGHSFNGANFDFVVARYLNDLLITTQPQNISICRGTEGQFSINGLVSPTITYQWQYKNGSTWDNVANGIPVGSTYTGQNTTTMTVGGISLSGNFQYRCYVTDLLRSDSSSIVTLTVLPTLSANNPQTICSGNSYTIGGHSYSIAGIYYDTLTAASGCDSIITTVLTVNPEFAYTESHSICNGQTYLWHGQSLITAGTFYDNHTSINGCDSTYTLTLNVNPVYNFSEVHSICKGSVYSWHGQSLTNAGLYNASYTSVNSCDSIYTLTLSIDSVNNSVSVNGIIMTADSMATAYQWVDCNNSYTAIPGAINQSYTPTVNGNYAVIISHESCTDTSACIPITTVGIATQTAAGFSIYPNPAYTEISISLIENLSADADLRIFNCLGEEIMQSIARKNERAIRLDISRLPAGMYFVKMNNYSGKFVKY